MGLHNWAHLWDSVGCMGLQPHSLHWQALAWDHQEQLIFKKLEKPFHVNFKQIMFCSTPKESVHGFLPRNSCILFGCTSQSRLNGKDIFGQPLLLFYAWMWIHDKYKCNKHWQNTRLINQNSKTSVLNEAFASHLCLLYFFPWKWAYDPFYFYVSNL